jgi:orotidine-5'-phosphate decarboxylase
MSPDAKAKRLIVALDVSTQEKATELVRTLKDQVGYFKIGLQLFTAAGPTIVQKILQEGVQVFLDLKLHDIPNTVTQAALEAARLGAHMLTLHTLGGEAMMKQTRETLQECSLKEGWTRPRLLGVTLLTSMDQQILSSLGMDRPLDQQVLHLARSAQECGLDGIVSSPRELPLLRQEGPEGLLLVTPGIRSGKAKTDDQRRTMTASEALAAGADYLVVGRPIVQSQDPVQAVQTLLGEIPIG